MRELSDSLWLVDLGFLVDITTHLNVPNTSLQGPDAVISQLYSHIKAFGTKPQLLERHLWQTQPRSAPAASLANCDRQLDGNKFREIRAFALKVLSLFGFEKTFSGMNLNKSCEDRASGLSPARHRAHQYRCL